jgi:hypothetical protein
MKELIAHTQPDRQAPPGGVRQPVGSVCEPIGHQRRVEFGCLAVVEHDAEFATVRSDPLQQMRLAAREEPEVAFAHVLHASATVLVQHRDPALPVGHVSPFGRLMPVQFADAARGEAHVDAGDRRRNREIGLRHLAGPAAALNALVRIVEGGPKLGHVADARGGRIAGFYARLSFAGGGA